MNAQYLIARIPQIRPNQRASIVETQFGQAVKVEGDGAKATAQYFTHDRYLNGDTDTDWGTVRHGLGYLIPLYENPIDALI